MAWQFQVFGLLFMSLNFNLIFSMPPNSSSLLPTTPHLCHPEQSAALLQFKNSFTIDSSASFHCRHPGILSYPKTKYWKEGVDCCFWDGVTCDIFTGNVIGLDLSCSWIRGPFNSNNTLFLLPYLQSLNLAFNNFEHSPISPKFGQTSSLIYLNLSHANFFGIVPTEISHLSKLVSLDLSVYYNNNLRFERWRFWELLQNLTELRELHLDRTKMSSVNLDSLSNLSSSLITLSLQHCSLQGKLPTNVFHLPNLQILSLRNNQLLSATLPSFNRRYFLKSLDLSFTGITGNLPSSIGELKSLETLNLRGCNFLGSIPTSVGNLTKLTYLRLGLNHFTGQIPTSLSNLESLVLLGIAKNNLYGVIPEIFHNLSSLLSVELSFNQLSGQIPSSIFNLNQLTFLGLGLNHLSGPLPDHITGFSSLTSTILAYNLLNGTLPSWLFTLPSLTDLWLSNNQFSGTLNFKIFSTLRNLKHLHLSFNNISLEFDDQENITWPLFETLHLSSCNLTSFPTFLSTQNQLQTLNLSYNRIQGEIPNWLWINTSLTSLDISHNMLTSVEVHPEKLKMLQYLDLRSNLIQAPLSFLINIFPMGGFPNFYMYFSNNKLTGEIPISICNINSLIIADFSNNSLSGVIPECLGSLNHLSVLNLRMNNLNGTISLNFSSNVSLKNLNLNGNQLEGSLPKSLANCKQLKILDIGNNNIQGGFPNWLESLPELQVLILRSNKFNGSIGKPNSVTPFQMLRIMDISNNAFTGFLPEEYFRNMKVLMIVNGNRTGVTYIEDSFSTKSVSYDHDLEVIHQDSTIYQDRVIDQDSLIYEYSMIVTIKDHETRYDRILTIFATIDFSKNSFRGPIPEVIGNFISLQALNFSHNNLSGQISLSLANMTALESLDLSSNALVGVIPQQLANLNFLEVLNVSYNQLEGPIPEGSQFRTFKNDSYTGNLGLCDFPLSRKCGDGEIESPPTPTTIQDEEDYTSSAIDWKFVMMGYASGLVIGLSMGYIVFTTRKPLWFVEMVERKLNGRCRRRNL